MDALRENDPRQLGPYGLLGRLGEGGMGQVYLGRTPDGRMAAVKAVHDAYAGDTTFRTRFAREIDTLRRVRAPWTVAIMDADPAAARPWLATEYVPGPSLERFVSDSGSLPEAAIGVLAGRLADALAAVHAVGVVHRDLKPSNVLLAEVGPCLVDFGIARAADATKFTVTGAVVGTPAFMAPEQANGEDGGPPADVFSLASTLVFAATGDGPFGSTGDPLAMLFRIADLEPKLDALPESLRGELAACLAKDPADRPTARELAVRFASRAGRPDAWPPPGLAYPRAGLPGVVDPGAVTAQVTGPEAQTINLAPGPVMPHYPPVTAPVGHGQRPPTPYPPPFPPGPPAPPGPPRRRRTAVVVAGVATVALAGVLGVVLALVMQGPSSVPDGGPGAQPAVVAPAPEPGLGVQSLANVQIGPESQDRGDDIVVRADGARAYVLSSHGVFVLDTASNVITLKINLPDFAQPHAMALSPDGRLLGVVTRSSLVVIDTATDQPVSTIPLGAGPSMAIPFGAPVPSSTPGFTLPNSPGAVALSPDGRFAYIANTASDAIAVVDLSAGQIVRAIPAGAKPIGLAITPDGGRLLAGVLVENRRAVAVIDTAGGSKVAELALEQPSPYLGTRNGGPEKIIVSPDGSRGYISARDDTVYVVDPRAATDLGEIKLPDSATELALSPSGRYLYAAQLLDAQQVAVIDTANAFVVDRISVEQDARAVGAGPDPRRLYVTTVSPDYRAQQPGRLMVLDPGRQS